MKRTVFIFGGIAGLIVALMMVFNTAICGKDMEFKYGMVLGYTGMIVAFSFIFVGIKQLRDKHYEGAISFGKAFQTGLFITLIASSIYVLVWLVEYYVFFPDFMDRYSEHMLKQVQASGNQVLINEKMAEMAKYKAYYKNPIFVILLTYAEILPVGLLVSLIAALILKRKPKPGIAY